MKTYLSSFDPRIVGLSGTEEEIAAAARTYKIYYRKVPTETATYMDHSATLFLDGRKGRVLRHPTPGAGGDTAGKLRQLFRNG